MKKVLVIAVALTMLVGTAGSAHAQVGYGGSAPARIYGDFVRPVTVHSGEVLGASDVSPEIQAQINALKAQLAILIQELVKQLQAQLALALLAGSH